MATLKHNQIIHGIPSLRFGEIFAGRHSLFDGRALKNSSPLKCHTLGEEKSNISDGGDDPISTEDHVDCIYLC